VAASADEPGVLVVAETDSGKVWANLSLARHRLGEPYLPIAIGILNKHNGNAVIDRRSLWLSDVDGILYQVPSVKVLRKGYGRSNLDHRMVSFAGIPWEVWYQSRRYAEARFFPNLRAGRRGTTMDRVTLRERYGMADLLYFEAPRGIASGKPFFLVVAPEQWQHPIRVQVVIP
jgi:hypothetical protein